jgi:hypothetical protein
LEFLKHGFTTVPGHKIASKPENAKRAFVLHVLESSKLMLKGTEDEPERWGE